MKIRYELIGVGITNPKSINKTKLFNKVSKDKRKIKVFLGGTCNNSTWREKLIKMLKIDYFNPVVDDWTPEAQKEKIRQRKLCDYVLYVITPLMKGTYSIAEVVNDSNKRPKKTLFCIIESDFQNGRLVKFEDFQLKSLNAIKEMIIKNGAMYFDSLNDIAKFLNNVK